MTTLSRTLRWFTTKYIRGEIEEDIQRAYARVLSGKNFTVISRRRWDGQLCFGLVPPEQALRELVAIYPIIKRRHPENYEGEVK